MADWQPIETAPRDRPFQIWSPTKGVCLVQPYGEDADRFERFPEIIDGSLSRNQVGSEIWGWDDDYGIDYDIVTDATHWQPLPDPPK